MMRFVLFWVLLVLPLGAAQTLNIDRFGVYDAALFLGYVRDGQVDMSRVEVMKKPFRDIDEAVPSFGFDHAAYWFKLRIKRSDVMAHQHWYLRIDYPLIDNLRLFAFDEEGRLLFEKQSGEHVPFASRDLPHRHFLFELPLDKYAQVDLLLRVQTEGVLQLPISVVSADALLESQNMLLLIGIYYGIFLIIFIYNLAHFAYSRDTNYLRYLLFLSTFMVWQLSFDGLGVCYVWRDWWWQIKHGTAFWILMTSFSAIWFGRHFLQTFRIMPQIDRLLFVLQLFSAFIALLSVAGAYESMVRIGAAMAIITPMVLLFSGIWAWRLGERSARFYVVGWVSFLVGSALFALNKFDLIEGFYAIHHIQQFGSALEMLFLSWALADRIHLGEEGFKRKLQKLNEELSAQMNETLASMRKKEQMISHQARLASMGEMIEQIAHQWRQPLNNMALINQDTYIKKSLGTLDDKTLEHNHEALNENLQYMSRTIDDFREFFHPDPQTAATPMYKIVNNAVKLSTSLLRHTRIDISGSVEASVSVKASELTQVFMNLIKNSIDVIRERKISDGHIEVQIQEDPVNVIVHFSDNGGGIEERIIATLFEPYISSKKEGTGIGLYLSKAIIEKYGGTIEGTNAEYGALFVIKMPKAVS
ncbi:MAG: sensor histidine kinase [Campylobacterales bacterium]|nr:sensor histidine kinase [Campylobacterales bacterium]